MIVLARSLKCCNIVQKLRSILIVNSHRGHGSQSTQVESAAQEPANIHFQLAWPQTDRQNLIRDMLIIEDFLTESEEADLVKEVDPYMQRLRYEFDHWDDAIHGFRETERQKWYPDNKKVIERVNAMAFVGSILPHIHVLDLAEQGVIKPHVDSSRYCGSTIAGLSLLSDSVMRLMRTDETKYIQSKEGEVDDYRSVTKDATTDKYFADILLKRRSLYIMKDTARYNFTHEILAGENSMYRKQPIVKGRRISVICRNKP